MVLQQKLAKMKQDEKHRQTFISPDLNFFVRRRKNFKTNAWLKQSGECSPGTTLSTQRQQFQNLVSFDNYGINTSNNFFHTSGGAGKTFDYSDSVRSSICEQTIAPCLSYRRPAPKRPPQSLRSSRNGQIK